MKALSIVLLMIATPALAAKNDYIQIGDHVAVTTPVEGGLIAAGGDVDVNSEVGGDILVFGGNVTLAGTGKQDVYVAGGDINIGGEVGDDLRVAGGQVRIGKTARIGGDVSVAGGDVTIAGDVTGNVEVLGGQLKIDGHVAGNVEATGGEVSLGPDAHIDGQLTYSSKRELRTEASGQVAGGIERAPWRHEHNPLHLHGVRGIWSVGYVLLALLVLTIAPGYAARVTDTIHDDVVQSLLFGLIALVIAPMAMILLTITVIGIPAALLLLLIYLVLLMAGRLFAAIAIGDIVLQRMRGGTLQASDRGARMLAAIIAVIVIGIVAWLPVIGSLVATLVTLLGLGAMLLQMRKRPPATA
jgi:cytoskeletal protein CcmA (bactofilin family)